MKRSRLQQSKSRTSAISVLLQSIDLLFGKSLICTLTKMTFCKMIRNTINHFLCNASRVFWYISQLTVFIGKKRKLSEDDSTDLRRKMLKKVLFNVRTSQFEPVSKCRIFGKNERKTGILGTLERCWREKQERTKKLNFPYYNRCLRKCVD